MAMPTEEYKCVVTLSGGLRVALCAKSSRRSSLPTTSTSSDFHRSQFKVADRSISRRKRPDVLLGGLVFHISFPTSGSVPSGPSRRGIRKSARFAHMRTHHLLRLVRGSVPPKEPRFEWVMRRGPCFHKWGDAHKRDETRALLPLLLCSFDWGPPASPALRPIRHDRHETERVGLVSGEGWCSSDSDQRTCSPSLAQPSSAPHQ